MLPSEGSNHHAFVMAEGFKNFYSRPNRWETSAKNFTEPYTRSFPPFTQLRINVLKPNHDSGQRMSGGKKFLPPTPHKTKTSQEFMWASAARASELYEDDIRWISLLSLTILSEELTRIFFSNVFMSRVKLQPKLTYMLAELLCVCLLNPSLQRLSSVGGGKHSMQFALQFNTLHGQHWSVIDRTLN